MRMIFGLVLVVGLALAGVAVYMAQGYINQTQTALAKERELRAKIGPMVEVFVVNKAKNYGDPLSKDDVQMIYWPKNALPETAFTDAAVLFPDDGKEPRFVLRQMEKFEPVLAVKVTEPGQPAGLTGQLEKGMRAFAIKVDVASGVSGFLQPGDRVDVYWTGAVQGVEGEMTRLIQSTIRIIAVDQTADANSGAATVARTVTVAATPEEVGVLAQAQATGRLALSLVGSADESVNGPVEVDMSKITGVQKAAPAPVVEVVEEKTCTIRKRTPEGVVEEPIPCTN